MLRRRGDQAGETQPEVVAGEFAEEIGGRVRPQRKIWEHQRPGGKLRLHWWSATLEEGTLEPDPLEMAEVRWCGVGEAEALPRLLESNVRFVGELKRGLLGVL